MTELDEFMKAIKERLPEGMRELKRPYRARLYCPREYVELANRGLNAAWGDSGDNLSREMSTTGRRPWTHKAGNYAAIPPAELRSLLEVFSRCPGSCCVVTPTEVDEIIGIFGIERKSIIGQVESFETTAEKLFGIRFSDIYYWELDEISSELILQAVIIPKDSTAEGVLVRSIPDAWMEIAAAIDRNPRLLFDFTNDPRRFEEFLAATYEQAGYEVVLTPRSSDRGRDVIASKRGFGAIRILDQAAHSRKPRFQAIYAV